MENQRTTLTIIGLVVLAGLVIAGLTLANYQYAALNPGGNDFLPRWVGTRLFLTQGVSPYSDQTTTAIQQQIYGRPARSGEDQSLFVYPLYSTLVFAPYAVLENYPLARALWMTTLEISLGLLALIGIALSRWRVSAPRLALLVLFAVLWYHGMRPVINGNASILVGLFLGLAFLCIRAEQDVLAAFLLALSSIKPQMVVLLIPFVLMWAVSQRRWALFWTTLGSFAFLVVTGSFFISDWVIQNLKQVLSYPEYTLPGTPGAIFTAWLPGVGRQMGWAVTIVAAAILIVEWIQAWGKDFRWFVWAAYLTLVITNLIGIRTSTENYIALFPGLILVFGTWDERWGRAGRWLVWLSMILLFFGLWALFLRTVIPAEQPLQHPIMFFPFPSFMVIGLYWVRWWATRPPRVYLDQVRRFQNRALE